MRRTPSSPRSPTWTPTSPARWPTPSSACTDFIEDSTAAQVYVTKGGLDREAYAACLADELDAATIRASVVASLMGEWDDPALVTAQRRPDDLRRPVTGDYPNEGMDRGPRRQ